MLEVTAIFHEGESSEAEMAYLFGNVLLSVYDDDYVFRVFTDRFEINDGKIYIDQVNAKYYTVEIPGAAATAPAELERLTVIEFVRKLADNGWL